MEAAMMNYSSGDYKHRIGNPKWNSGYNRTLFSHPSDNLLLASFLAGGQFGGGSLITMPPLSHSNSYPPAVSVFRQPYNLQNHRQQPPLLPLPISMPVHQRNLNISRANSTSNCNIKLSSPRINKNVKNRGRDQSLTPKKSKNQKKDSKKEEADLISPPTAEKKEAPPATVSSISEMTGPDPKDLPKDVTSRVFSASINKSDYISSVDKFSGSVVFTPSPPPSSLPLPKFSLRPKVSCHVEAAIGVDAGATDNLRRLLRLP